MKQWEVILYPFPVIGSHPAVVISPDEWCSGQASSVVNALSCTSLRHGAQPRSNEVRLDEADGLDWATVVRCNLIHQIAKASCGTRLGCVSVPRRRAISKRIIECLKLDT